jgi:putative transposon-encoded protein
LSIFTITKNVDYKFENVTLFGQVLASGKMSVQKSVVGRQRCIISKKFLDYKSGRKLDPYNPT